MGSFPKALFSLAATSGAVAAADPDPVSKAAIAGIALTAVISAVAAELVSRSFRKILGD